MFNEPFNFNRFANPDTPDLGCLVRRAHDFRIDSRNWNIYTEVIPTLGFTPKHLQTYIRVLCGHAAFYQRCFVYMTYTVNDIPPPLLEYYPPDWVLGGNYAPYPSDWVKYPTQTGQRYYWFVGQHRNPQVTFWQADVSVGHVYDIYENGTLSTVQFNDTNEDEDFDDFIIEVAVVNRIAWSEIAQAENQASINKRFIDTALPELVKQSEELSASDDI